MRRLVFFLLAICLTGCSERGPATATWREECLSGYWKVPDEIASKRRPIRSDKATYICEKRKWVCEGGVDGTILCPEPKPND